MELTLQSHCLSKMILCRSHCDHCNKTIRFFGLRCRICRTKFHKNCSNLTDPNCFSIGERKPKPGFLRRSFAQHRSRKKKHNIGKIILDNRSASTNPFRWKLGPHETNQNSTDYCQSFQLRPTRNLHSPTGLRTCVAYNDQHWSSPRDVEFFTLGTNENSRYTWHSHVTNNTNFIPSSGGGRVALPSAVSSGYSSVNQSCSSSAGTGSHRSRSPTPDQFETVQEEAYPTRYGDRLMACDAFGSRTKGHIAESVTEEFSTNNIGQGTASSVGETSVFFMESDEESSGEWDERENCERFKPRPGLRRKALRELEIRYSDLEIDEKVGIGPNGPVYRGRWHGDVMVHTRQTSKQNEVEDFRKEVALLSMIRHENVMLFMGACLEPPNLAVVTSLRKCLSMHYHLHCQESRLSLASRLNIMLQVAQGMSYLHAKGITVPCLRTMNIYLESKVKLCINDYTYLHHQVKRDGYGSIPRGHLTYLAPEVISKVNVDLSTGRILDTTSRNREMDAYAYATVMYEILTDKWPFANLSPETVIWMIGKGLPQSLAKVKGPDNVKDLIKSCWSLDPSQRPSFVQIIQVLKQINLSTNCISRRHSISEPEKIHCIGKPADLCHLKRI